MARKGKNYLAALDIGSSKVSALVGHQTEDGLEILGAGATPSDGCRRGVVVNIESTSEAIKVAVEEAERTSGVSISSVSVNIAGEHITGQNSHGIGAVEGEDITAEDVEGAIQAAKAIAVPRDRQILHCLPQSFSVDGLADITDPIGMTGVRLEVRAYIVTCAVAAFQNVTKPIIRMGLDVTDVVLQQLATSEAVLSNDERDLGVALVDIGGDSTDVAIFHKGVIRNVLSLPFGGKYVTSDIAMGLRTPLIEAEKIKIASGLADLSLLTEEEIIEIPSVGGREPRRVSRELLVRIIEPRIREILRLTAKEISKAGYDDLLAAGVVLTGGGSLLGGIANLGEEIFRLPARCGFPIAISTAGERSLDPTNATGVGLLQLAAQRTKRDIIASAPSKWLTKIRKWFK